jgi:HTH-type transcriptional regulator, competence development regulator
MMTNSEPVPFGKALRELRASRGISLRSFADQLGVSATYLSQVEQCNAPSPTADRIQHMAKLLNANPDPLLAMAGRIPDELAELIHRHPVELPRLIRVVAGWKSEEIASLVKNLQQTSSPEEIEPIRTNQLDLEADNFKGSA